jgi:hypothetical protein
MTSVVPMGNVTLDPMLYLPLLTYTATVQGGAPGHVCATSGGIVYGAPDCLVAFNVVLAGAVMDGGLRGP